MSALIAQFGMDLVIWIALGAVGLVGMIALVSPRTFESLSKGGNHWVDTNRWLAKLDRPIDVDKYILPFSRLLGAVVLIAVIVIGVLYNQR